MDLTLTLILFSVIFFLGLAFYIFFRKPQPFHGRSDDSIRKHKLYNLRITVLVLAYFLIFNFYTVFSKEVPFEGMNTGRILLFAFTNLIGITAIGLLIYAIRKNR